MSGHTSPTFPAEAAPPVSPEGAASEKVKKSKRKEKKPAGEKRKKKSQKPSEVERPADQPEEDAGQDSSEAEAFHDADQPPGTSQSPQPSAQEPLDDEPLASVSLAEVESESDGVLSSERTPSSPSPLPVPEKPIHEHLDELTLSSPPRKSAAEPDSRAVKHVSRHTVRTSVGNWRALGIPSGGPSPPPPPSRSLEEDQHSHPDSSLPADNDLTAQGALEPYSPPSLRIIDLDAGRAVSWREIPTAPPPLPPRGAPAATTASEDANTSISQAGGPARYWPGVSLANVSAGASSLTSGLGRSLAASIASVRRPQEQEVERARLPRREVDEEAVAQDVFRFADAKDQLLSTAGVEDLRALGIQLEAAWREKLSDSQALRSQVEETADVMVDLEDENENLRDQLSLLSEQVVSRDETSEAFQRSTVIAHEKERQTWQSIVTEGKDHAQTTVAHARRLLCEERAATAQLRLVLHALKAGKLNADNLESVDLGPDPEQDLGENLLDQPEESEAEHDLVSGVPAEGVAAMPLKAMQDAGLVPENEDQEVAAASSVLFDKAATDAALLRALREENGALRSYQQAKEHKYRLLQDELEGYRRQLAEAEEALNQENVGP